jgi:hypothetical protein
MSRQPYQARGPTITRHPSSETSPAVDIGTMSVRAKGLLPGDFILVHSHGRIAPKLIGFGQKLHHDPAFAYWTHAALYVGIHGDPDFGDYEALIEAKGGQKIRSVPLSQYDVRDYVAVRFGPCAVPRCPLEWARSNAVRFAESQLGHGYAYLGIMNVALWTLLGGRFTFGVSGESFCSGLVASALTRMGEIFNGEPGTQEPADLAQKYGVRK